MEPRQVEMGASLGCAENGSGYKPRFWQRTWKMRQ